MKLQEVARSNHPTIESWLAANSIRNYKIQANGTVDVFGDVRLGKANKFIPIRFGSISGDFKCDDTRLTSFAGGPHTVRGDFWCGGAPVSSLEGAPQFIGGNIDISSTKIKSLHGIDKIIKQATGMFFASRSVTHILGLLLINGLESIDIDTDGPIDKIMNKYVNTGDILSAQDELIDAGFKEQARL